MTTGSARQTFDSFFAHQHVKVYHIAKLFFFKDIARTKSEKKHLNEISHKIIFHSLWPLKRLDKILNKWRWQTTILSPLFTWPKKIYTIFGNFFKSLSQSVLEIFGGRNHILKIEIRTISMTGIYNIYAKESWVYTVFSNLVS